jgi:hypothetical protein
MARKRVAGRPLNCFAYAAIVSPAAFRFFAKQCDCHFSGSSQNADGAGITLRFSPVDAKGGTAAAI